MESIIVAIITGTFAVVGQLIISLSNRRKNLIDRAIKEERVNNRLDSIETKLDIHNGYAAKLGEIEKSIVEIKTEIKGLKERSCQ